MEQGKRRRQGERVWREHMGRFGGSGLTVAAFCEREGLSKSTFTRWRAKLAADGQHDAQVRTEPGTGVMQGAGFVELGALAPEVAAGAVRMELRLELGAGVTLHVVRG